MLAINGGEPVCKKALPARMSYGKSELAMIDEVLNFYISRDQDPPYQGVYEERFCNEFAEFHGGGYADAVATGTAAVYVALAALNLPKGSDVLISPVTDSGPLNCIILQGYNPVLLDSAPDSYNINVTHFLERITPNTKAIIVIHTAGEPLQIDKICEEARKRDIKVLEDCSQAPGALCNGKKVGTFGDISAFSTMYRKNLIAGSSSGIVYTKNYDIYQMALGHADRGKQIWRDDINLNDPSHALFPALNFNTDEISCAIGVASLGRLQETIDKRILFIKEFIKELNEKSDVCRPYNFNDGFSPFFFPVFVDTNKISCSKIEFAKALIAEGISGNEHYGGVISSWEWAKPYMKDSFVAKNASDTRDNTFNLHINEKYGEQELADIISALLKVEKFYKK